MTDSEKTPVPTSLPLTPEGVESFLAGRYVDGIGPAFARKIVDSFGTDSLHILRDEPEKALTIPGLGESRLTTASESLKSLPYAADTFAFLYSCGLSDIYIDRIVAKYKHRTADVILNDPYSMVEDVWQLSFFTADKIGRKLGISDNDPRRIQGALVTAVKRHAEAGHLFATPEETIHAAAGITGAGSDEVRACIRPLAESGRIVDSRGGLYLPVFYKAEKEGAAKLSQLASSPVTDISIEDIPPDDSSGHIYSPTQREAIRLAVNSPVMVLTGGPGTGKTTVLRGIIDLLDKMGKKTTLAAPTGRAAKRMSMLTGRTATTIHRLLGYIQGQGYSQRKINTDVLIIDEGSMMEQVLFNHLLQALKPDTKVLIVGDVDQLPAIGAGNVLQDMIASEAIPVATLEDNFRQSKGSLIASGAKAINSGKLPESDSKGDFIIIEETSTKRIHDRILSLMAYELPDSRHIQPFDIQVVTPQQIGPLGARQLNIDLQQKLNPEGPALKRGATTMRLRDPVMQTANSRERGVYNGEVGRITKVDTENQTLEVTFSDGHTSQYNRPELSELTLAYATTVHKLQGSEVRHMIFPVTMAHKPMLYRNLLYTGVSRATDLCVLVGEEEALRFAIGNSPSINRNSNFKQRISHV